MAQSGSPYSCESRSLVRNQTPCNGEDTYEKGRLNDYAAVLKGTIPKSVIAGDYKGLLAAILAAEKLCKAFVMRDIIGTYDCGAPKEAKGAGRQATRNVGRTGTIVITDFGISNNEDFWDVMESQASDYDHFVFGDKKVYPIEADPKIFAKNPITDDSEADIEGEATYTFTRRRMLKGYDYDRTPLLKRNAPFLAFTGLTAGGGTASVQGETVTATKATPFSVTAAFTATPVGAELKYAIRDGQTLPEGLELLPNGVLSVAVGLAAGEYDVSLQASNPCGILGEVAITFVVA